MSVIYGRASYGRSGVPEEVEEVLRYMRALEFEYASHLCKSLVARDLPAAPALLALSEADRRYFSLNHGPDLVMLYKGVISDMGKLAHGTNSPLADCAAILQVRLAALHVYLILTDLLAIAERPGSKPADLEGPEGELEEAEETLLQQMYHVTHWTPHQLFVPLKRQTMAEVSLLRRLLAVRRAVRAVDVKEAMFGLHRCKVELGSWEELAPQRGQETGNFAALPLAKWLAKFYDALLGKSSAYFANFLGEQGALVGDSKLPPSSPGTAAFAVRERVNALVGSGKVSLVAIVLQEDRGLHGDGWSLARNELRGGLAAWPALFHAPHSATSLRAAHWPNVVSMIMDHAPRLQEGVLVVYYDRAVKTTYVLQPIEPRITLVFLVVDKRAELAVLKSFASNLARSLRIAFPRLKEKVPVHRPSASR